MSWINKHKRTWRTAVFILLLVSIIGPWTFDRIHVPAKYACEPPNVRLEGDFCGVPLVGLWIFAAIIGNFFSIGARLFTKADAVSLSRELLLTISYTFLLLPFFTTLLLIFSKERRARFQWASWGLAIGVALLFLTLSGFLGGLKLWGILLYVLVAVVALLLELFTIRADRQSSEKAQLDIGSP